MGEKEEGGGGKKDTLLERDTHRAMAASKGIV